MAASSNSRENALKSKYKLKPPPALMVRNFRFLSSDSSWNAISLFLQQPGPLAETLINFEPVPAAVTAASQIEQEIIAVAPASLKDCCVDGCDRVAFQNEAMCSFHLSTSRR